jgi:hypothetical protein
MFVEYIICETRGKESHKTKIKSNTVIAAYGTFVGVQAVTCVTRGGTPAYPPAFLIAIVSVRTLEYPINSGY